CPRLEVRLTRHACGPELRGSSTAAREPNWARSQSYQDPVVQRTQLCKNYSADMVRLRRVSPQMKGWSRRRAGRGFSYRDGDGAPLPAEEVERIKGLAIPPAWKDVWICPHPNGH